MLTLGTNQSDARTRQGVFEKCLALMDKEAIILTCWTFLTGRIKSVGSDYITFEIYGNGEEIKIFTNEIMWIDNMHMIPMGIGMRLAVLEYIDHMRTDISKVKS